MILVFVFLWDCFTQEEIVISENEIFLPESANVSDHGHLNKLSLANPIRRKCSLDAYFACLFANEVKKSLAYRSKVAQYFSSNSSPYMRVRFIIHCPSRHIIDYRWGSILNVLCYEKRELDSALAWLSTLGGAFSALGDDFETCAMMAGRISVQQLKLAFRLGDPRIMARCRLYYALSLIQQKRLKTARYLVENVYRDAITNYATDKRLKHMCLGIWTKLQFEWRKKYKRKSKRDTKS